MVNLPVTLDSSQVYKPHERGQTPYHDEAPSTPRRRPRPAQNNLIVSVEIPPDIALATQFSLTLTPTGTPARPTVAEYDTQDTPNRSPIRAGPIPAPNFASTPPPSQRHSHSNIYRNSTPPPQRRSHSNICRDSTPPPSQPQSRPNNFGGSTPLSSQSSLPEDPFITAPPHSQCQSRTNVFGGSTQLPSQYHSHADVSDDPFVVIPSQPPLHPSTFGDACVGTFGQDEIPILNNQVRELDPSWPHPVYPCESGNDYPDSPLPNIPLHPKKYYMIFKGLRIGVFYEKWCDLEPLCKRLKGGRGNWKGAPTLREAIVAFEREDNKAVIPNI